MTNLTPDSLSQANQSYIKSLSSKKAKEAQSTQQSTQKLDIKTTKDEFNKKTKKNGKIAAIVASITLLGTIAVMALKNPEKARELIARIKGKKVINKNLKKFNTEKLFNEPIDFKKLSDKIANDVKDIELNYGFDEKTITDGDLLKKLKTFGFYNPDQNMVDELRAKPQKLHLLNLLSGLSGETEQNYIHFDFNRLSDCKCTQEEMDTYFRLLKRSSQEKSAWFIFHGGDIKRTVELTALYEEALKQCELPTPQSSLVLASRALDENQTSEFAKFISSLKKGTIINDTYWFKSGLEQDNNTDYRKARKFYESLKPEVLKKIEYKDIIDLCNIESKKSIEVSEILNNTPEEIMKKLNSNDLANYVEFHEYYGVKNINELSIEQKKVLLQRLVKSNTSVFAKGKNIAPILPSNQEEYCKLMDKLAKSIGINTKPLTTSEAANFNKGISNIAESIKNVDLNNATFKLDFSRKDFVEQIETKLKKLTDLEKAQVMDYFGFEIEKGILKGYPINVNNGEKLKEIESAKVKKIIEEIRPIVQRFCSSSNKVTIEGAPKLTQDINEILEGLPELRTMFGKAQHETHAFTLDIHTFKVLQNVCQNPNFKKLSQEDKKVLEIASLLHDITKAEGLRDAMHPIESSFDAFYIIQKLNLTESQQLKVYELVKTHNWLQLLNDPKNKDMIENIAQDIAFDSRHTNTFEMAKILCEADLKSVKKDSSFFRQHKKTLDEMSKKVDGYVKKLHETQITLPQTVIPKASATKGTQKSLGGITNTVLYMDDLDDDLSKYGFASGTTKENWTALVHALEKPEQMSKFDTFSIIDNEALLSTSFINPEEYRVFRKQGLILDVNTNDIHAGYEKDFGTGYGKSIELLKQDYLFKDQRIDVDMEDKNPWRKDRTMFRNFVSDKIKARAGLSDEQYYEKLIQIQDCKSITDIEKVDKDFAKALLDVFKEMHNGKRRGKRNYNEVLVSRPKIQGVFAYDKEYSKIPEFLRKYAQDNDLPIIIFGAQR